MSATHGLNVFNFEAPIVTIHRGNGWIINGHFNLVHVINLESLAQSLSDLMNSLDQSGKNEQMMAIIDFHLHQARERLDELQHIKHRNARSIDWLGSAWKWLAGSPDAADWNQILQSQGEVIENSNQQYKINKNLFGITHEAIEKVNQIITRLNSINKNENLPNLEYDSLNKILILKEQINEIIRGCQMAKSGIVNSNLLDREEINNIIAEMETLPYQNVIEAIEYGKPSVFTNGTMLLYVLAMPKIKKEEYHLLTTRSTISQGKRVDLEFDKILVNQKETYGIVKACFSISNSTVCEDGALRKLPEGSCIPRLIKGGNASCRFVTDNQEVIELIDEDTLFLTNFQGNIMAANSSSFLNGTYVIQMNNETIHVKDKIFSSHSVTNLHALPPVLTTVTKEGHRLNLEYIHDISLQNVKYLNTLNGKLNLSIVAETLIVSLSIFLAYQLWRRITSKRGLPIIKLEAQLDAMRHQPPISSIESLSHSI